MQFISSSLSEYDRNFTKIFLGLPSALRLPTRRAYSIGTERFRTVDIAEVAINLVFEFSSRFSRYTKLWVRGSPQIDDPYSKMGEICLSNKLNASLLDMFLLVLNA